MVRKPISFRTTQAIVQSEAAPGQSIQRYLPRSLSSRTLTVLSALQLFISFEIPDRSLFYCLFIQARSRSLSTSQRWTPWTYLLRISRVSNTSFLPLEDRPIRYDILSSLSISPDQYIHDQWRERVDPKLASDGIPHRLHANRKPQMRQA